MAEVLECYADVLVRTNRQAEGLAMKSRSEAIWRGLTPLVSIDLTAKPLQPKALGRPRRF